MGMQNRGWRSAGARLVEDLSNIWTFSGGAPISRDFLLATASPSATQAQFGGTNRQIISGPVAGAIKSNGGAITVTSTGVISGGPDGVDAVTQSITKLTNRGAINGAAGAASASGGLGVSNFQTITTLPTAARSTAARAAPAVSKGARAARACPTRAQSRP